MTLSKQSEVLENTQTKSSKYWRLSDRVGFIREGRGTGVLVVDRLTQPFYEIRAYFRGKRRDTFQTSVFEQAVLVAENLRARLRTML